jgi:hypothetical protein
MFQTSTIGAPSTVTCNRIVDSFLLHLSKPSWLRAAADRTMLHHSQTMLAGPQMLATGYNYPLQTIFVLSFALDDLYKRS